MLSPVVMFEPSEYRMQNLLLSSESENYLVNGRGQFSTPTAPRPQDRLSWNLKYIN